MRSRKSNFVLNQTVALTKKIKSCRQDTLIVKLEKGNNLRIHCSTTALETVRKLIASKIGNSSTLEYLSNKGLKGNIYIYIRKFVKQTLCFLFYFYCVTHTHTGFSFIYIYIYIYIHSEVVKVKENSNTTRRNKRDLFTVNIYI